MRILISANAPVETNRDRHRTIEPEILLAEIRACLGEKWIQ